MANFRGVPPRYDIRYKNSGYNYGRLRKAHQNKDNEMVYFSNHKNTGDWLRNSRKLRRLLGKDARRLLNGIKAEIPRGEGTGGYHLEDAMKIRFIKHGGYYGDRMAYHIYVMGSGKPSDAIGDAFLAGLKQSQFTKDAWRKRMDGISTKPNRAGWIRNVLNKQSIGSDDKDRLGYQKASRFSKSKWGKR